MSTLTIVLVFSVAFGVAFTCPAYWTAYGGYCYRVYGSLQTWHQAEGSCQRSYRGKTPHLASIHSYGENAFVKTLFETTSGHNNGRYWIGLNDLHWTMHFRWSDGTSFDYEDWLPNEPNNDWFGMEDCGEIYKALFTTRVGWNDALCSHKKRYVCKMTS